MALRGEIFPRQVALNPSFIPPDNRGMYNYDLICLGCGPAGEKAATQAAFFKHKVAVVERATSPGGAMVNTGTIPSKALRETALLCSSFNRRPLPGMNFKIDHHVSIAKFMARRLYIEQQEHDRIENSMDRHGIRVHQGFGSVVDPHTVEVKRNDGSIERITSKYILIATGSSPLRPLHIPFDDKIVVDADSVLTIDRVPGSMIIAGGGVIGCEYASIFAEMDVKVTLVQKNPPILAFIDPECRERLIQSMAARDVDIVYDRGVESVQIENGRGVCVKLDDGQTLRADLLLWAAGRKSNIEGLGLDDVGIKSNDRGLVLVNQNYQTDVPSIYAVGDVIGFPALAATSMEQGRIAACHMFNLDFKKQMTPIMPIGIYTVPAVSMVGLSIADVKKENLDVVIGRAPYRNNVRGRMLGDENGLLKCIFDRKSGKLLGAACIGEDATELIHYGMSAIAAGRGIEEFIGACFNYPSLTELYKYAAYSALQAINSTGETKAKAA